MCCRTMLPLGSLLGAIARFSLQTSARNQLFGTDQQRSQPWCSMLMCCWPMASQSRWR